MVFKEYTYRVLLVSSGEKFGAALTAHLPESEYYPVHSAKSCDEARRILTERKYDFVLINTPLPDDFGIRLAVDIAAESDAGVLLFVRGEVYDDVLAKVTDYGVLALPKPTPQAMIRQSLKLLCATRERIARYEEKQLSFEEKMDEIRLVNRAKWRLIECLKMTEEQAHRYIEKQAMDERLSKRAVAEAIIKTYKE